MLKSTVNQIGLILVIIGALISLMVGLFMIFFQITFFLIWGFGLEWGLGIIIMALGFLTLAVAGIYQFPRKIERPWIFILILGILLLIFNAHVGGIFVIIGSILMIFK